MRADAARTLAQQDAARYTQIQIERRNQVNARSRQLGSRTMFRGILDTSQLESMTNQDIIDLFESNGYKDENHNGRVHVKDAKGQIILRTDPPDSKIDYHHVHLSNKNGQALDKDLTIIGEKDPAGHIKYGGPGSTDNNDSSNGNNTRIPGVNDGTIEDIMPEVVLTPPIINLPAMPMPVPGFVFAI